MSCLSFWLCLWMNIFVLAPPSRNINQNPSPENFISSTPLSLTHNLLTATTKNFSQFDLTIYRSSWKFLDKKTIRVRFRLNENFLRLTKSIRFLLRHIHTGKQQVFDDKHEIINSTLTIYLRHLKQGRHTVCALLYSSKLLIRPRHIFCQEIINNFQKYGHHDTDADDVGNTFVFLLTQYAIVGGILIILQLVHATRKRKFLKAFYDKANALRQAMLDYHHRSPESKSPTDLIHPTSTLNYLIYNLDRNALYNFDHVYVKSASAEDSPDLNHHPLSKLRKPSFKSSNRSMKKSKPMFNTYHSVSTDDPSTDHLQVTFSSENHCDEDQLTSFKSLAHILEENKPWLTRLTDDGSIKHSILSSSGSERSTMRNRAENL